MPVAVKFRPGVDQHIFGKADSAQTSLSALHPANRTFIAGRNNDHQIHVTVFGRRAPRMRAEQPYLLGLKLGFQPFDSLLQKTWLDCLHGVKSNILAAKLKG